MTGCWKGSRPCFMLSALVYLALPIPCDADHHPICVPPQVGDSWTYNRRIEMRRNTRVETVTVSVVGTEQSGDQEYYQVYSTETDIYSGKMLSENVELYRASADGVIWRYYPDRAKEVPYFDLWGVGADQEGEIRQDGEIRYEGVFFGRSTKADESEWGPMELARRGPFEMVVGDSLYSEVFEFWIKEGCCSEFYVYLYVHPEIGAVKMYVDGFEYLDIWELIDFSRQSNVPIAVREVTWGTVKKRHMFERLR